MIVPDLYITTTNTQTDKFNRTKTWTEKISYPDGNQLSKRVDEYSYYPTGEIDIITLNTFGLKNLISTKTLKHYRDCSEPLVTISPLMLIEDERYIKRTLLIRRVKRLPMVVWAKINQLSRSFTSLFKKRNRSTPVNPPRGE